MSATPDPKPDHDAPETSAPDSHLGAVEGDRPQDPQQGNANVPALDEQGLPRDRRKICEDTIGANVDRSQG